MAITSIRGFNDILPGTSGQWRWIEETAFSLFGLYGFSEIRIPVVEKTELFCRSIGETTDIVEKEMYTFPDRRGDSMTLRPEGTASVVRAYIERKLYTAPVSKLCYTGPMFRYERPQKGRYRQFYQIGAEVLGDPSPGVDAETLEMLMRYFAALGVEGVELKINSLGCAACRPAYKERLLGFLKNTEDRLCENCVRRIGTNPLRALDCKSPGCIEATVGAPEITDCLCGKCNTHFEEVKSALSLYGHDFIVDSRMVRGLDYYSRTTFEITSGALGSQNAVAAGGRYDSLVKELGGPDTPCFGFAIGMERLALVLGTDSFSPTELSVFIPMGAGTKEASVGIVRALRESGLPVAEDFSETSLKSRMKRADRLGARFVMILGADELAEESVTLKDMAAGTQDLVKWNGLESLLAERLTSR